MIGRIQTQPPGDTRATPKATDSKGDSRAASVREVTGERLAAYGRFDQSHQRYTGGKPRARLRELGPAVNVLNSSSSETFAKLVIVSIPQKNAPDLADGIVDAHKPGAPAIETNNYYYLQQRDGEIAGIEHGQVESAWVAGQIGAPVYKSSTASSGSTSSSAEHPAARPNRIAPSISGEDGHGRDLVRGSVDALGFDPVDAGPISESWRQQPGTPVYGEDFDADNTRKAPADATPGRIADLSARTA